MTTTIQDCQEKLYIIIVSSFWQIKLVKNLFMQLCGSFIKTLYSSYLTIPLKTPQKNLKDLSTVSSETKYCEIKSNSCEEGRDKIQLCKNNLNHPDEITTLTIKLT